MKAVFSLVISLLGLLPIGANGAAVVRSPSGSKTVIAQMFEWNWDSLAQECTDFLGPAGYGYIQGELLMILLVERRSHADTVSPAHEHPQGPEWSSDYEVHSKSLVHGTIAYQTPGCFVQPYLQARRPCSILEHDYDLSQCRRKGYRR